MRKYVWVISNCVCVLRVCVFECVQQCSKYLKSNQYSSPYFYWNFDRNTRTPSNNKLQSIPVQDCYFYVQTFCWTMFTLGSITKLHNLLLPLSWSTGVQWCSLCINIWQQSSAVLKAIKSDGSFSSMLSTKLCLDFSTTISSYRIGYLWLLWVTVYIALTLQLKWQMWLLSESAVSCLISTRARIQMMSPVIHQKF